MKKTEGKQKPKPLYTMIIEDLGVEFELSAAELIFMCKLQSMATANVNSNARVNYKLFSKACRLHPDNIKEMIRRLMYRDLIKREGKGLYSTNGHFRRRYNQLRFEIQENNGYKTNMKILKDEREKDSVPMQKFGS